MPKMKTHQGTKKRVRLSASGKLMRQRAYTNHLLEHKSAGRKRNNSKSQAVNNNDEANVKRALRA